MSSWKASVRLIAAIALMSVNFVPANAAAKFCAEFRSSTATGHPDCSFATLAACRAHIRAGGGGHCYKLHP